MVEEPFPLIELVYTIFIFSSNLQKFLLIQYSLFIVVAVNMVPAVISQGEDVTLGIQHACLILSIKWVGVHDILMENMKEKVVCGNW